MGLLSMHPSLLQMSRLLGSSCTLPLKWSGLCPRILQLLTGTIKTSLSQSDVKNLALSTDAKNILANLEVQLLPHMLCSLVAHCSFRCPGNCRSLSCCSNFCTQSLKTSTACICVSKLGLQLLF